MIPVVWTAEAREDRLDIWNFIAAENRSAANTLDLLFESAATNLARLPAMGRPGKPAGTKELFPTSQYRLVCQFNGDLVIILSILHTARRWPPASA